MRPLKARQLITRLKKFGFQTVRVRRSHHILQNTESGRICVVPYHGNRDIPAPVIINILKQAGLSIKEFLNE